VGGVLQPLPQSLATTHSRRFAGRPAARAAVVRTQPMGELATRTLKPPLSVKGQPESIVGFSESESEAVIGAIWE
jgi:hypothetical protein